MTSFHILIHTMLDKEKWKESKHRSKKKSYYYLIMTFFSILLHIQHKNRKRKKERKTFMLFFAMMVMTYWNKKKVKLKVWCMIQLEEKKWNKKTLENFHLKRWRLGVWSEQRLFCPFSLFVQTSHHYFLSHHETLAQEPHTRSTKTSKHELKLKNYQNQEFQSLTLLFFLFYHVQPKFD
jgi:hypothetical protein